MSVESIWRTSNPGPASDAAEPPAPATARINARVHPPESPESSTGDGLSTEPGPGRTPKCDWPNRESMSCRTSRSSALFAAARARGRSSSPTACQSTPTIDWSQNVSAIFRQAKSNVSTLRSADGPAG